MHFFSGIDQSNVSGGWKGVTREYTFAARTGRHTPFLHQNPQDGRVQRPLKVQSISLILRNVLFETTYRIVLRGTYYEFNEMDGQYSTIINNMSRGEVHKTVTMLVDFANLLMNVKLI